MTLVTSDQNNMKGRPQSMMLVTVERNNIKGQQQITNDVSNITAKQYQRTATKKQ